MSERIPAEIIQRIDARQAREYALVPFAVLDDTLECYGDERDYSDVLQELEILYNIKARIRIIENDDLQKLLKQYYRTENGAQTVGSQGFLMSLIEEAFDCYASDIHLEIYEQRCRVRLRVDGKLIERYVLERDNYPALVNQIKIISSLDISEKRLPQDGRILFDTNGKKFDLRVSCLPTIYGEKIVLRLLTRHAELLELSNLGFSEKQLDDYCAAIAKPHGMVLICGPTGSGKSTTLYATLRRLNSEQSNILTIEDPVEYTLEGVNQVQLKEEIGMTFSSALRTFLRQDPDIIMLGEVRDPDTAQMAIRSSLTGHLIFSTIHTNTAWGSVARLIDMGVHPYLISNTLVMCVAQRLVRLLCPHCKKKEGEYFVEQGCEKCFYTGYSGRRAVYEVIPMDDELSAAARANVGDVADLLRKRGIVSMRDAALEMVAAGETSYSEILSML